MNWIHPLGSSTLVALNGDASDCAYVLELLQATAREHALNEGEDTNAHLTGTSDQGFSTDVCSELSCPALAHFLRHTIAEVSNNERLTRTLEESIFKSPPSTQNPSPRTPYESKTNTTSWTSYIHLATGFAFFCILTIVYTLTSRFFAHAH